MESEAEKRIDSNLIPDTSCVYLVLNSHHYAAISNIDVHLCFFKSRMFSVVNVRLNSALQLFLKDIMIATNLPRSMMYKTSQHLQYV